MQIRTIRKGFEELENYSSILNQIRKGFRSIRMQIRTIRKGIRSIQMQAFKPNSNHSKRIRSIRIQIRTIWKGYEAFERIRSIRKF